MSTPSYDVIVIGAGPAGLVTATEVARTGLKTLCLDKLAPGGALINLTELHDFEEPWAGPDPPPSPTKRPSRESNSASATSPGFPAAARGPSTPPKARATPPASSW